MKILALVTDAFGGHGGIALYNRDLLTAICAHPDCSEVVAIPRFMPNVPEEMPTELEYVRDGLNSKLKYLFAALKTVKNKSQIDLIICGHINLLPIAWLVKVILRAPLLLELYGVEAWEPPQSFLGRSLVRKIDAFISISDFTEKRFLQWSRVDIKKGFLLPNAIDISKYGIGSKDEGLIQRYGLKDRTIIMTLGRIVSSEGLKGFDEVLALLPELIDEIPNICYLIAGNGDDQLRLKQKAENLGVADHVVFTGFIPEAEKANHYRLADVYVMPSRQEGFGFVFLEAMACGIPVIASKLDGSREAVRNGKLGSIVDPTNKDEIKSSILSTLKKTDKSIPEGLEYFSYHNFEQRVHQIIDMVT